jgi:hypothetical protein
MEKIRELFKQAGVSETLSSQIVESLEKYRKDIREQADLELKEKIKEAKKICVEEVDTHKRDLARKVQIFFESQVSAIERKLIKSSALKESDALSKLRDIRQSLEGITIGESDKDSKALHDQMATLKEERDTAIARANRANALAEKALQRNRTIERKLNESKATPAKTLTEGTGQTKRIDQNRNKPAKAQSTRPTILENQNRNPIAAIADGLD